MSDDPDDELERCLDELVANPDDLDAHLRLLDAALRARAAEVVAQVTERLIAGGVDHPTVTIARLHALRKLGRREEERALLDQLIARDAAAPWLVARAEAALALGLNAAAMDDLDRALALDEAPRTLCLRAKVRAQNARFDEARIDLHRAAALGASADQLETTCLELTTGAISARAFDVAVRSLSEGIALAPSAYLLLFRAKIRRDLGDVAGAQADVDAATAIDAEVVRTETAADGDFAMDDTTLTRRMRAFQMSPETFSALARAAEATDPDDPQRWLAAISDEPIDGVMGHWLRGCAAFEAGQAEVALRELSQAQALVPDNGDLGEACARVLIALGDDAADDATADACYRRALEQLDRLDAIPWVTYPSRLLRAVVLNRLDEDGAEPILDALIDEHPERPEARAIRAALVERA